MDILRLRDNRFDSKGRRFSRSGVNWTAAKDTSDGLDEQLVSDEQRKLLEKFKDWDFGTLESLSPKGVVVLSGSHLDTGDRKSLRFLENHPIGDDGFRLDTGNLMGVLRFRDPDGGASVQVEVLSRFDKGTNNFFLNYLLLKAFNCAFGAEEVAAEHSSLLDLLLDILFVRKLGEAAKNGLLRQYRTFRNNDWDFKGRLDLPRHLRENVPLPQGIAYVKREIDFDVPVNRMILLAALAVRRRHPSLFENNESARDALRELRINVPEPGDVRAVLAHRDCREPIRHPFYRDIWEPLRGIARMILEDERWTLFGEAPEEEVSGVVFDGSWLWEEYVATVLEKAGLRHGTEPVLRVFKYKDKRFVPDFYRPNGSGEQECDIVLDAKYKRSNPAGQREDVHQVLCYLLLTGAKLGGLVFPPVDERCESADDCNSETYGAESGRWSSVKNIASPYSKQGSIRWSCFSWASIKDENMASWDAFRKYMESQEGRLKELPSGQQ